MPPQMPGIMTAWNDHSNLEHMRRAGNGAQECHSNSICPQEADLVAKRAQAASGGEAPAKKAKRVASGGSSTGRQPSGRQRKGLQQRRRELCESCQAAWVPPGGGPDQQRRCAGCRKARRGAMSGPWPAQCAPGQEKQAVHTAVHPVPVALAAGTRIEYCFIYGGETVVWSAATVKSRALSDWVDVDFDDGGRRTVLVHAVNRGMASHGYMEPFC